MYNFVIMTPCSWLWAQINSIKTTELNTYRVKPIDIQTPSNTNWCTWSRNTNWTKDTKTLSNTNWCTRSSNTNWPKRHQVKPIGALGQVIPIDLKDTRTPSNTNWRTRSSNTNWPCKRHQVKPIGARRQVIPIGSFILLCPKYQTKIQLKLTYW